MTIQMEGERRSDGSIQAVWKVPSVKEKIDEPHAGRRGGYTDASAQGGIAMVRRKSKADQKAPNGGAPFPEHTFVGEAVGANGAPPRVSGRQLHRCAGFSW